MYVHDHSHIFLKTLCRITSRQPLTHYLTAAISEGRSYQVTVETVTDVDGDTATTTTRVEVPLQPPGTCRIEPNHATLCIMCVCVCVCVCAYRYLLVLAYQP